MKEITFRKKKKHLIASLLKKYINPNKIDHKLVMLVVQTKLLQKSVIVSPEIRQTGIPNKAISIRIPAMISSKIC